MTIAIQQGSESRILFIKTPTSETQGQLVGAGRSISPPIFVRFTSSQLTARGSPRMPKRKKKKDGKIVNICNNLICPFFKSFQYTRRVFESLSSLTCGERKHNISKDLSTKHAQIYIPSWRCNVMHSVAVT